MTDYKSRGATFRKVLLGLQGFQRKGSATTRPLSFPSLYIQVSRAVSWDDIHLSQPVKKSDFMENRLDPEICEGVERLVRLDADTRQQFFVDLQTYTNQAWYGVWSHEGYNTTDDDS